MIKVSDGFHEAVIGVTRRMLGKAVVEIIDPDVTYGSSDGSGAAPWSKPEQLHDKVMAKDRRYATLEPNRWLLDGTAQLIPDNAAEAKGQIGHVGNAVSGADGTFEGEVYAELPFTNVSILQACSVYFSTDPVDGIPADFRVAVLSGNTEIFSREFTDNKSSSVSLLDFTVYDPTAIRVYVTRWSLPGRRIRVVDIIPGLYEEWDLSSIVSLDVQMRGNFADLALPYGTANLRIKNTDRRFEPYTRSGIFKSIEERQSIPISLGPVQADGTVEYSPIGVFYQRSGGWTTGQNDMYIDWQLVDICGLLADRDFRVPDTLPTTLGGWFQCFAAQLGENFVNRWHVDPDYINLPLTINDAAHLQNRKCGAMIRYACMATGTWPRADQETGDLTAEPLWSQGSKIALNQMYDYPVKRANDALASLTFKLYDGSEKGSLIVISGNSTSSSKTLNVDNPFIHNADSARTAARQILSQYGGIKLEATTRGDPATEIGDVDTIQISNSEAKTGRRMEQAFRIVNGIMKNNRSVWLQADGSFLFEVRHVLTGSGKIHIPAGVTEARLIIGSGAQGGGRGEDGYLESEGYGPTGGAVSRAGNQGVNGAGGYIWSGVINVNPDTDYEYSCGVGGKAGDVYGQPGEDGTHTTFGAHSSANGKRYTPSFTDLASGSAYGRAGVLKPLAGSSDGGAGGEGGEAGQGYWKPRYVTYETENWGESATELVGWDFKVIKQPGKGKAGVDGADGFVVIYWDKEAEA